MSSKEHKPSRQKRTIKFSKDTSSNDNRKCVVGNEKSKTKCEEPEMTSDIASLVSVDDWFKQRTESVSSMDLDVSMKSECMDVNYLGDSIECIDSNNLLSTKDTVDMCLVTNICDIGIDLDMPNISSCDKTFVGINDQDINEQNILNDYNPEHESLLLSLEEDDLLDKDDISAEGMAECMNSSRSQSPVNQSKSAGESCTSVEALDLDEDTFTLSNSIASMSPPEVEETIEKCGDEDYWIDNLELPESIEVSPAGRENKNSNKIWDGLPIHRRSGYLASERDFLDLNDFLSLQSESQDDTVNCPSESLLIKPQNDAGLRKGSTKDSEYKNANDEASYIVPISINGQVADVIVRGEKPPAGSLRKASGALPQAPSTKSRSLLKRNVWPKKSPTLSETQPETIMYVPHSPPVKHRSQPKVTRTKTPPKSVESPPKAAAVNPMTIIAISTDKAKKTTQVVINTSQGEQVFKGKTSEFMKAKTCAQARTIRVRDDLTGTAYDKVVQSTRRGAEKVGAAHDSDKEVTKLMCKPAVRDETSSSEDPDGSKEAAAVVDALSEVGITDDSLSRVQTAAGERVWACPVHDCNTVYLKITKLRLHLLGHYGIRPFKCDFLGCEWSFYKYFKLRRHKETHEKRKNFKCTVEACERTFTTVYNLKTHIKLHERPAEVLCKVAGCSARFQTKRKLEVHLKNHDPAFAPYKCRFKGCGKSYYSANAITSHCRSHQHSEDELRCQFCNKLYDKPCRLRFHMRSHTGDKPFSCSFDGCSWAFTSSSKLKRHMFKHTNERKFVCSVKNCGKSFMRTEHLKEHILTHSNARCFACPVENCTGRFQARSSLYSHLKKHRARNAQEKKPKKGQLCPISGCTKLYGNSYTLRKHVLKVHSIGTPKPDVPPMDYIAMLDEVDDLAGIENLQFVTDLPTAAGETEAAAEMGEACSPPPELISSDFINTSFEFQSILLPKRDNSGIVPTALGLVTSPEKQSVIEAPPKEPSAARRADNKGCARTSCTLGEIAAMRARKAAGADVVDVALETAMLGTHDIGHSFLMQEELAGGQFLYQDEAMLAGGASEYEVLLDHAEDMDVKFSASTINMRDLE